MEFGGIMNEQDLKRYMDLSDFLSSVMGPDYEILVYDLKQILYILKGHRPYRPADRGARFCPVRRR